MEQTELYLRLNTTHALAQHATTVSLRQAPAAYSGDNRGSVGE